MSKPIITNNKSNINNKKSKTVKSLKINSSSSQTSKLKQRRVPIPQAEDVKEMDRLRQEVDELKEFSRKSGGQIILK